MSFMHHRGQQVHPDELTPTPVEPSDEVLLVRFGQATTRTTASAVCARLGLAPDTFHVAMAALQSNGWLTLMPDGSYVAEMPEVES